MAEESITQQDRSKGVSIKNLQSPLQPLVDHYAALMRGGMTMLELKDLPETKLFADIMALGDDYENEVSAPEHAAQRTKNFVNMIVKQVRAQDEIFNRPVTQKFSYTDEDGKHQSIEVPLTNPDTQQPLLFGDILKGRSGPEHNMMGRYQRVDHILEELSPDQRNDIDSHHACAMVKCLEENPGIIGKFNLEELTRSAASALHSKNGALRIFSDYDLCIGEQDLYNRAIAQTCEEHLGVELSPELQSEVGLNALLYGGEINKQLLLLGRSLENMPPKQLLHNIESGKPISYSEAFNQYLEKHPERFFHCLNFSQTELYKEYGIAFRCDDAELVSYQNNKGDFEIRLSTEVYKEYSDLLNTTNRTEAQNDELQRLDKALGKLKATEGKNEYYDIILSDQSIAPDNLMSRQTAHNQAITSLLEIEGVTPELIERTRQSTSAKSLETEKIILALSEDPSIKNESLQKVADTLANDMQSALANMHAEDTAKKLAQTTTQILQGKQSKAVGNEHDAARFLAQLEALKQAGNPEAAALQQMTAVMFVTSGLGWDLNEETLAQMQKRDVRAFSEKLDEKVYHSTIRDKVHDIRSNGEPGTVGSHAQESFDCYTNGFAEITRIASTENAILLQQNFQQMQQSYENLHTLTKKLHTLETSLTEQASKQQIDDYETLTISHQNAHNSYLDAFSNMHESFQRFIVEEAPAFKEKLEREGKTNGVENAVEAYTGKLANESKRLILFARRREELSIKNSQTQSLLPEPPTQSVLSFSPNHSTTTAPGNELEYQFAPRKKPTALLPNSPLRENISPELTEALKIDLSEIGKSMASLYQHDYSTSPQRTFSTATPANQLVDKGNITYEGSSATHPTDGGIPTAGTKPIIQEPYSGR